MSEQDTNLKVGNQTPQHLRDQQRHQRGENARPEQAKAPDAFRHQNERAREQPEINDSQQRTRKAPESDSDPVVGAEGA